MTDNTSCVVGTPSRTVFKKVLLDSILSTYFVKYEVCNKRVYLLLFISILFGFVLFFRYSDAAVLFESGSLMVFSIGVYYLSV